MQKETHGNNGSASRGELFPVSLRKFYNQHIKDVAPRTAGYEAVFYCLRANRSIFCRPWILWGRYLLKETSRKSPFVDAFLFDRECPPEGGPCRSPPNWIIEYLEQTRGRRDTRIRCIESLRIFPPFGRDRSRQFVTMRGGGLRRWCPAFLRSENPPPFSYQVTKKFARSKLQRESSEQNRAEKSWRRTGLSPLKKRDETPGCGKVHSPHPKKN